VLATVAVIALATTGCTNDDEFTEAADGLPPAGVQLDRAKVRGSEATLDRIVEETMAATGVPGVQVGVVHDGQVVFAKGYGVAEAGTDRPVTPETVFQLASVSKPIGATAVAAVVGRGDLAWDQPVVTELPDFQLSSEYVTQNVTVADLYSHRSGLPGDTGGNDLETIGYDQASIIPRLRELPLAPFRATYSYSNFGLTIGGLAAAAAYGAPFAQMAQEVLFGPAGMTSTSFSHDEFAQRTDTARLHVLRDGVFTTGFERDADAQAPAGGASSNVVDLNRWMLLQLAGGELDGQQIVDAEALAETKRSHINQDPAAEVDRPITGYGLGWNLNQSIVEPSLVEWSHSGAFTVGTGTAHSMYPELDLGVVVLTNAQPTGAAESIIATYVDTLLHGEPSADWTSLYGGSFSPLLSPPPLERPAAPVPARDASAYVGTYANAYFGDVVVRSGAEGLEMVMGPGGATVFRLEPYDGDQFSFTDLPEIQRSTGLMSFTVPDGASVASDLVLEESLLFGPVNPEATWRVIPRTG
jgi:CubicO group peptidase (beta-lactamase class C family)